MIRMKNSGEWKKRVTVTMNLRGGTRRDKQIPRFLRNPGIGRPAGESRLITCDRVRSPGREKDKGTIYRVPTDLRESNSRHTSRMTGRMRGRLEVCLLMKRLRSTRIFSLMTDQSARSSAFEVLMVRRTISRAPVPRQLPLL